MSDTEIILSEPYGDEAKALRYRQRVKRLSKGTCITSGRWCNDEESCVDKDEGEEGCSGGGIEGNRARSLEAHESISIFA
ncbi:unnamed protein product [Cuscuta campestris]|uniref:Uncharacterized protein n=1 Tax=Cuscuta campestris TaxID=132261 RepID=A0A484LCB1_9ASTE|nr:unnamed protein product [Cuscuta campestris]